MRDFGVKLHAEVAALAILQDEIRTAGLYRELWQSFCVLPADLRSVGVQGDERTYGYVVVIRAVTRGPVVVGRVPTSVRRPGLPDC